MKWRKFGRIFCPSNNADWMRTHAAVPIAEHIRGNIFRILFSSRDAAGRSHTGYVIVDLERLGDILELSSVPVLSPGALGEFDDSGAMATWLTKTKERNFLYYIGWNLGVTVPFRNSIGLAVGSGEQYVRYASGPILDRSLDEPHFCASCCVIAEEDRWKMWYVSCTGWTTEGVKPQHRYHIKYAESDNGIHWRRDGSVAIDYIDDKEYAISRPSVVRDKDRWRMWYSCRGRAYRIGYAESETGKNWIRQDHRSGIDVSASDWDSEMIEYPFVFDHRGERFMLYNGNGYGTTGFGLAILER
jgi:hypothetical protein